MPPTPAGNPSFPLSLFPNAVDELSNQPDPETAHAVMAIQSCLIGGSSGGAPSAPGLPPRTTPLLFTPDNTSDIGASGANRPRNIYAAGQLNAGSSVVCNGIISEWVGAGNSLIWNTGAPAAGLGINGDFYFRTDTPATSLQRRCLGGHRLR